MNSIRNIITNMGSIPVFHSENNEPKQEVEKEKPFVSGIQKIKRRDLKIQPTPTPTIR